MLKHNLLLIILFIPFYYCNAQSDTTHHKVDRKIIVSAAYGMTKPFGETTIYQQHIPGITYGNNIGGTAKSGYYYKVDIKFAITDNIGVSFTSYTSQNKTNPLPPSDFGVVYYYTINMNAQASSTTYYSKVWNTSGVFVGLCATKHFKVMDLNFKLLLGEQEVASPETEIDNVGTTWLTSPSSIMPYSNQTIQPVIVSLNLAAGLGIDCSFNITKRFKLNIGWDEYMSKAKFVGTQNTTFKYTDSTGVTQTGNEPGTIAENVMVSPN